MQINQPMFVLQRRINQPLGAVERLLCDPSLLQAAPTVTLADGLTWQLERPFAVTFPPFGLDHASWCAPATVSSRRGRTLERFDVEIGAWDAASTELLVRPRARHPYRWTGRRMRRYFRVAHATADALTCRLGARDLYENSSSLLVRPLLAQ